MAAHWKHLLAATGLVGLLATGGAAAARPAAKAAAVRTADVRFVNGHIYTPTGWKTAMAVRDGRIVSLDTRTPARQVIDLKGQTVLPGLYDMHVHPILQAKGGEGRCRVPQDANAAKLLELVAACVKQAKPGEWVTGGRWQASLLEGTPITAATLDAISPDNPLMLFDVSGHSVWANSKALAAAGISDTTPNPEGGIIERDAAGKPTGVLRETAGRLVTGKVPPQSREETGKVLREHLQMLASYGVVGYVEAMAFRDDLEVYADLADKGLLKQRVQACIAYSKPGRPIPISTGPWKTAPNTPGRCSTPIASRSSPTACRPKATPAPCWATIRPASPTPRRAGCCCSIRRRWRPIWSSGTSWA
jgi:predicted amidohydrolase YtcJ